MSRRPPLVAAPKAGRTLAVVLGLAAALSMGSVAWTENLTPPEAVAVTVETAATQAASLEAAPLVTPPQDPWRGFNRASYGLNRGLDRLVVGPVARVYRAVMPGPVQRGLGRVLDNLREPSTLINAGLQGHPKRAAKAGARFVINSTVGVLGLFDVAGRAGLDREPADFGQTLGRYGVGPGPYLFVPLLGPSNVRDGLGRVVDALTDPVSLVAGGLDSDFGLGRAGAVALDSRAQAEPALQALEAQATDPYVTLQSAYLQARAAVVAQATGVTEDLPDFNIPNEGVVLLTPPDRNLATVEPIY